MNSIMLSVLGTVVYVQPSSLFFLQLIGRSLVVSFKTNNR